MPRLLFEKTGNAVWISHLDLMRLFQRAFKRAGLPLKHTQGFNPRPFVSIALPLSVGIESQCELLDCELETSAFSASEIRERLNQVLISGVRVLDVYENAAKLKELAYMKCNLIMEYDGGLKDQGYEAIRELFSRQELIVEKKNKNGISQQNITPMIRKIELTKKGKGILEIAAVICCQNPSLNPMQIQAAIVKYLPEYAPDYVLCRRVELYDTMMNVYR